MKIIRVLPLILIGLLLLTGVAAADTTLSSLTIHVIDDEGHNIENAKVTISSGTLTEPIVNYTGSDGFVRISLNKGYSYDIVITKDGYNKHEDSITLNEYNRVLPITLTSVTKNVRFYVFDETNTPLKGITVTAKDKYGEYNGETNDEGCAIISLAQDNTYSITTGSDYYTYIKDTIDISKDDKNPTYTYNLSRASVSPVVTVYNDKKNVVPNASVYLNGKSVGTTSEFGKCRLPTVDTGEYPLNVLANGYIAYSSTEDFKQDTNDITVELQNASSSITITVKDANGTPLEKASVYSDGNLIGTTDSKGTYTFPGDVGKSIKLSASLEGYTTSTEKTYTVVNGENTADITLEAGTSYINITVKDTDGAVVPEANLYADGTAIGQTDTQGSYRYATITGKTHQISASKEGYSGESITATVQPGENSLNLTLKKEMNVIWIVIAGAAGLVIILVIVLVLTRRKRDGFDRKRNNGGGKYTNPPSRRDSL